MIAEPSKLKLIEEDEEIRRYLSSRKIIRKLQGDKVQV